MIHTLPKHDTDLRNQPLGGLVAAVHNARRNNPSERPLPKGFAEHSRNLPSPVETWAGREFTDEQQTPQVLMFQRRHAR